MENKTPEINNVFTETSTTATPVTEASTNNTSENDTIKVSQEEVINAVKDPNKTFSIISLVCGILSMVTNCCCCGILSIPLAIAAVVLAFVDKSKNGKFNGLSIAGLVLGIIGLAFYVISLILNMSSNLLSVFMSEL